MNVAGASSLPGPSPLSPHAPRNSNGGGASGFGAGSALFPQDVTEHLTAAIQLSAKHIHLRFLEEAETLLSLQMPAGAIAVAGVVLESLVAGQRHRADPSELQRIEKWSHLRNAAVHSNDRVVTLDEAREMLEGVRRLLLWATASGPRVAFTAHPNRVPGPVRGKYKFVPTSSEEFIARKVDELRLER